MIAKVEEGAEYEYVWDRALSFFFFFFFFFFLSSSLPVALIRWSATVIL